MTTEAMKVIKCMPADRAQVIEQLGEPTSEKSLSANELRMYYGNGGLSTPAPAEDVSKLTKAELVAKFPQLNMGMSKAAMLAEVF